MQTSEKQKKKMKDPVKAILAVVLFFVCLALCIVAWVIPAEYIKVQDFHTVIVGGSMARWGIDSATISDMTGSRTINLGIGPTAMSGRYTALQGALKRYKVDTLILDMAYDALASNIDNWTLDNAAWIVTKMVTPKTAARYCIQTLKVPWYDYGVIWGDEMEIARDAWHYVFSGEYPDYFKRAGTHAIGASDMSIKGNPEKVHKEDPIYYIYTDEDIMLFHWIMDLCQKEDIRLVIVTLPLPESTLWRRDNWDFFHEAILDMVAKYDCEYYDYNLYKDRALYFQDETSYADDYHLCYNGAQQFSQLLSEEVLTHAPEDVDIQDKFYDSYEEALKHIRYAKK